MRLHRLYLLACLFSPFSLLDAQHVIIPGSQWIYEHNTYEPGIGHTKQTIESISVVGDTIIHDTTYSIVRATSNAPCGVFTTTEYLRETDNKIYRRGHYHNTEMLMMKLDVKSNYSIQFESDISGETKIENGIVRLDSFGVEHAYDGHEMEVIYLRILNNQSFDDDAVYKIYPSVGFVQYGILFPNLGTGLCDINENIGLRCRIIGQDTTRFTQYDCFESSLISSVNTPAANWVSLYPVPAIDNITIPDEYTAIEILNLSGQKMPFSQTGNILDISGLNPGLFVARLTSGQSKVPSFARFVKIWFSVL